METVCVRGAKYKLKSPLKGRRALRRHPHVSIAGVITDTECDDWQTFVCLWFSFLKQARHHKRVLVPE